MTQLEGLVQHVETQPAQSFATAAAAISDTVVYVAQIAPFLTESGTCTIDIAGVEYTATPDTDTDSLTVSPALSVAVDEGDLITLTPPAEIKWAFVVFDGDDSGDWMQCRVPHELVGYVKFEDGPRELDAREAVLVETEPEPRIVTMSNQPTSIDATTTPIIVTNAAGESATVTADGFLTSTNDPVPIRAIPGNFSTMTASGGYIYGRPFPGTQVRKFDTADGSEVTSGWPISASTPGSIAAYGGFVYTAVSGVSIRKWNASTGVEVVTGGWPKVVGGVSSIYASGAFVYLTDGSTTIRKYAASDGVEDTTADWPISGDFRRPAISGGYVYAADGVTGAIRKFDEATGTEDTSGAYPLTGSSTYWNIAADDTYLYAPSSAEIIDKIDIATGEIWAASGFPIEIGSIATTVAVDGDYLLANDRANRAIRLFNRVEGYQSTNRNSSDGSDVVHRLTLSDLTADGISTLNGPTIADYLAVTWTKARKTAAQTTATGTPETLGQSGETYGAFDGSGTSGDTAFWTESNGVFTILEDGVYRMEAMVQWASNATGYRIANINVSSVPTTALGASDIRNGANGQVTRQPLSCTLALAAGDTVYVSVLQNSGGNLDVSIGSWLSISRVGALAA